MKLLHCSFQMLFCLSAFTPRTKSQALLQYMPHSPEAKPPQQTVGAGTSPPNSEANKASSTSHSNNRVHHGFTSSLLYCLHWELHMQMATEMLDYLNYK